MIKRQGKKLKNLFFTLLAFLIFQGSKAQTTLAPGDMAIIGINYDVVPYELTMVTFVNISAGTTIRITDYGYDSALSGFAAVSLTNTAEGSIAWTTTGSIAANTVIKMTITVATGPSVSGLPGTVVVTGWTNTAPGTCPSPAGGDNWFIFQGPNATTVSNWVFGWTNPFATTHNAVPQVAGQFLQPGSGAPNNGNSYIPPGLTLGLTAIALNYDASLGGYHGDNNVYTGIKCGTQNTVLSAICSQANWLTNETTTYNIDPGGTYFPGVNPIFCVTQPCPTPTLNLSGQTNVACFGGSTGSATVSASGGGPFTYTWSPSGGNAATASGLSAGTYTCVTTNSCGSTASRTVSITQPASALNTSTAVTNVACFGGSTGSATVTASGGTPGYTYLWSTAQTTSVITGLNSGVRTVTVTDANGCTSIKSITISQPASALNTSTAVTNVLCFGGSTGSATVTASGGTPGYTYLWSSAQTTSVITGLNAGVRTVTVTDANGCTSVKSVNISQPGSAVNSATAVTNILCNGGSTGSATVTASGGTAGYTYSWSTSATTSVITGQTSGVKTVTVTDANGCTNVNSVNINQPSALVTSTAVTNVLCFGNSTGSATVTASGGTAGYTYLWSTSATTSVITGQTSGVKTVTVTDANGCTSVKSVNISQPGSAVNSATAVTNILCNGGSNGSATVTASGGTAGYTYSWSTSATTSVITGQNAGVKTVTVTDANGCTSVNSVNVTQPTAITATQSQTNITCNGASNGMASVSASGGTGSLTYSWSPAGGTAATATGLSNGSFTCTITDANSCSIIKTFTITQPLAITASVVSTASPGCGLTNGAITISASGGTGSLTYSWSPLGGTTSTATGIGAGSYTCTVKDANNCSINISQSLSNPNSPSVSATTSNAGCAGQTNGSITLNVSGGTPGYTYSWSPSVSTNSLAASLGAGVYNATVTDASNCTTSQSYTLTAFPLPTVTANSFSAACNGNTGCLSSSGANTYTWTGPCAFISTQQSPCFPFNTACSCAYTVTGTDANGCKNTATVCLNISPNPTVTASTSNTLICVGQSATLTANGAVNYVWNPGGPGTSISVSPTVSTTYTVTGTSAAGCTDSTTFTQNVSACTGLQPLGVWSSEIVVYPNPNNGLFTLEIQNVSTNTTVSVINLIGQTVIKQEITGEKTLLDIRELNDGVYFVQLRNNSQNKVVKIIKE